MRVLSTIHSASSVLRSVKAELDDGRVALYVAYVRRIDVYVLTDAGIQFITRRNLNSRMLDLQPLANGRVLVTTDPPNAYAMELELDGDELVLRSSVSLVTPGAEPTDDYPGTVIAGTHAFSWHYKGKLTSIDFTPDAGPEVQDCQTRERTILSACKIADTPNGPVLAVLHEDFYNRRAIVTRVFNLADCELGPATNHLRTTLACRTTNKLIYLSAHKAVLTLGGLTARLFRVRPSLVSSSPTRKKRKGKEIEPPSDEHHSEECSIAWDWGDISSSTIVDDDATQGSRLLVGDVYGRLVLLTIKPTGGSFSISKTLLGHVSSPITMSYLDSGVVFIGSHYGDSQLVRLQSSASADGSFLTIVDAFDNIGPIFDAVLVEDSASNQTRIVTCSGMNNTGSLRVVQKSAELEHLGSIDATAGEAFPSVLQTTRVCPVRPTWNDPSHNGLLVSSHTGTTYVRLSEDGIQVVNDRSNPFISDEPTLTAGNLKSDAYDDLVVQITPSAALLVELGRGKVVQRYEAGVALDMAAISGTVFLAARKDGSLWYGYVQVKNSRPELVVSDISANKIKGSNGKNKLLSGSQISAICVDNWRARKSSSQQFLVAHWGSEHTVSVYDFIKANEFGLSAEAARCLRISLPAQVCSMVWTDFGYGKKHGHLLAGCIDGTVVVQRFSEEYVLDGSPRTLGLGSLPIRLTRDGDRVLACGSSAVVLYWEGNRLQQSSIALKDVTTAISVHAPGFENANVFVSPSGLHFARIGKLQRLHIRTHNMGFENPRKIAHDPFRRTFGVGCIKVEPVSVGQAENMSSHFKILDQDTLETLSSFPLDPMEDVVSVACLPVLPRASGEKDRVYVVGTTYIKPGEDESSAGRVIVYGDVEQSGTPWAAAVQSVPGSAYALASVDGVLAVAVNTQVQFYALDFKSDSTTERAPRLLFRLLKRWNRSMIITSLSVDGNTIAVCDAITSITLLRWEDGNVQQISQHFSPLYPTTLVNLPGNSVLAANVDNNLYSFRQRQNDERVLEPDGSIHLGEQVNKFVPGALVRPRIDSAVKPRQLYFTSTGAIGIVAEADEAASAKLYALQRNLAKVLDRQWPDHDAWRAPTQQDRPMSDEAPTLATGFLDGDLLERFFDLEENSTEYQRIVEGDSAAERLPDLGELKGLLGDLQSLQS